MADAYDLYNELNNKINELNSAVASLERKGSEFAEAERDYKVALSKEVLLLRDKKLAATIIPLVVYGVEEIAKLRFDRDVAEVLYQATQEKINAIKLQIRILENQISRELGQTRFN